MFVFGLRGVVLERMPLEQLLREVARVTTTSFNLVNSQYRYYQGTEEQTLGFHLSLCLGDPAKEQVVRELHDRYARTRKDPVLIPNAVEAILLLRDTGKSCVCWTHGVEREQNRLLCTERPEVWKSFRLTQLFRCEIIVPSKTRKTALTRLVPTLGGKPFTTIGSSAEYDIAAVEGLADHRIWVSGTGPSRNYQPPQGLPDDVVSIETIAEFLPRLAQMRRELLTTVE